MQSRTVLLLGVLACVIVSTSAGKGGKGNWMEKFKKCGDGEINVEEAMKGKEECKEDKSSEETRRRRSPHGGGKGKGRRGKWPKMTEVVCYFKKQGLLNDDGQFNEAGTQSYVDKVYPEKVRTDAMNGIKQCADEHSSKFSMDNDAAGYKDFKKCVFGAHMKTCGIDWKGMKGKGKGGHKKHKDEEAAAEEE